MPFLIRCFLEVVSAGQCPPIWYNRLKYCAQSTGLLDLFTPNDIASILELTSSSRINELSASAQTQQGDIVLLHLMIAIGAQCKRGRTEADCARATKHFCIARKVALLGMMDDPTVSVVKIFLLMAFYMLGACRRNSAFMYVGIASRAADIIGLHLSAEIKHLSLSERFTRQVPSPIITLFAFIHQADLKLAIGCERRAAYVFLTSSAAPY